MGKTPPRSVLLFLKLVYYIFVGFVTLTFVLFGYGFVVKWALIQTSEVLTINMAYLYVSVPIAGLLWLLFLVEDCYREFFMPKSPTQGAR
jgi:TRAP-type C4-dicarboxylate transport system permease small subunit